MAESNNHMHINFSHSGYSVAELITVFQLCSERISVLHEHSSDDFKALNIAIRNHYKQISAIHKAVSQLSTKISKDTILFSKEAENSLQYISSIVTDLQFHDIIKQKLEHIQQTIQEIIDELVTIQKRSDTTENQPVKYLCILSEITKLHAAQLMQTNQDYQRAFAGIRQSLEGIEQNSQYIVNNFDETYVQYQSTDIKEKLLYINWLAGQLSAQINCSLLEIKYCESFACEVEEINKHMYSIFSGWIEGIKSESQADLLYQLEALYTMESERAIHNKVFNAEESTNPAENSKPEQMEDDNLELF